MITDEKSETTVRNLFCIYFYINGSHAYVNNRIYFYINGAHASANNRIYFYINGAHASVNNRFSFSIYIFYSVKVIFKA